MSYETYKILHVFCALFFAFTVGLSFFVAQAPKWVKIFQGIATLLIFVAGMGLMARLGISHKEGWPLWVKLKVFIWFALGVGVPLTVKRLSIPKGFATVVALLLFLAAISFAVLKPGM